MEQKETALRERLTGALIGLARAAEGNETRINPETEAVLLAGLASTAPGVKLPEEELVALVARIGEEKRRLVPDCFACAAPCSRTSDYAMEALLLEDAGVRRSKLLLLCAARSIAAADGKKDEKTLAFIWKVLIMLGVTGYRQEDLIPVLQEAGGFLEGRPL